jgi:hypothetical protein
MRARHRVARLARDERGERRFVGCAAALDVHLQHEDLAPLRGTRERRRDRAVGALDHGINLAFVAAARGARLHVQRAPERVVGELRAQGAMARAQRVGILRLRRRNAAQEGEGQGAEHVVP